MENDDMTETASTDVRKNGHAVTVVTMVMMFFMIGFVSMLTSPISGVIKSQFHASNALSQFGSSAHYLAYFFAGIFGGMLLRKKGYKVSSVCAMALGVAVLQQLLRCNHLITGVVAAGSRLPDDALRIDISARARVDRVRLRAGRQRRGRQKKSSKQEIPPRKLRHHTPSLTIQCGVLIRRSIA